MQNICRALIFISVAAWSFGTAAGQTAADDSDIRSWNDLQITAPLTKNIDLYTNTTIQFRDNITRVDNTRFSVGTIFKPTKQLSVSPFITFLSVRNSHNQFRYEYRLSLRGVYRFPFKPLGISHRSQLEYRFRPGSNSWRYRPSITFEKQAPEKLVKGLKAFVTEEPFYDSAAGRFSRNRFSVGINKSLNQKLSVDLYYLIQGDNFSHPRTQHILGTAWKVKL